MTKLRVLLVLVALAAVCGAASSGHAQSAKRPGGASVIKSLDTDNDGTLDLAEVKKAASAKFKRLDRDNDGTLDKAEAKSAGIDAKAFARTDPDKDGTLSEAEYLALLERRFKAADPDKDGTLDEAELKTRAGRALVRMIR